MPDAGATAPAPRLDSTPSRFAALAKLYYLVATPLFVLLDYAFGANIRVAFLDGHAGLRAAYYAIAIGCGVAVWRRPRWAALVGVTESGANIGLLIIGVFVAYLGMLDDAGGPGAIANPFTPRAVVNLVISAAWGYASYVHALRRLNADR
jgi:hypothetical protein